jgi:uncharacterized protein (DUF2336 family)
MDGQSMSVAPCDLLNDLEQAFALGTPQTRVAALWHATDTLLVGQYSEENIWLFGEVIDRLAAEVELQVRVKLAILLSRSNKAPSQTIRKLACDDSIMVAGPVLRNSERLKEGDLIEAARSKGQHHLLAIAQRKSLSEPITDLLVARGDQRVTHAVVKNEGARFSESSFWHLVKRSENDSILAECVGMRQDIPRHLFLELIAKASDVVKQRLALVAPASIDQVQHAVADAAGAIHARFGPGSRRYFVAKRLVMEMHRLGELDESQLCAFAGQGKFEEATVAYSLLCRISSDIAERALIESAPKMLLILSKSAEFSWDTVKSLILMRAGDRGVAKDDMNAAFAQFCRLSTTAVQKVLQFYEARRQTKPNTEEDVRRPRSRS